MMFAEAKLTNEQLFNAVQLKLGEIEAALDKLYELPRSFTVRQSIEALGMAHTEINREAAEALLTSAETMGAVAALNEIAAVNIKVASHMVILTGIMNKATPVLKAAEKIIKKAQDAGQ